MPLVLTGRWRPRRLMATALVATAAVTGAVAPAADAAPANPGNCVVSHALSNPFAAWGDGADYALAPAGDFETAGWTTTGAAATVAGNQPFDVGSDPGTHSLGLAINGVATSAPMCIDDTYPHFRFFARGTGATVKAEVLYLDDAGAVQARDSSTWTPGRNWAPSPAMAIDVPWAGAVAPVRFRLSVTKGAAQLDDVYVDPYGRG